MSLDEIHLNTVEELYAFVEMAIPRTGLVLDTDALFRPWARAVSAECKDVRWVYPGRPLSEALLRHLANFAHRPLPDKGFILFEKGQLIQVVDVNAVDGSSQPHRLAGVVQQAFAPKRRSRARFSTSLVDDQGRPADPYQVLGANEMDSDEDIKKKYKQMVMQYHPDRVAHLGQELKELAAKKTTEINCAFEEIRRRRGL